ncbi:MAG: DUF1028 domain-containing protein [Chloroflexi bacterium]|nr:DUF1028 domain-containing protein [Chloroflexota bacterium]
MNRLRDLIPTYSIVAFDADTGQLGVGVQSHYFGVGRIVPWAEYGVGAVATQSFSEYSYGPLGLDLMRAGKTAEQALDSLLASDSLRELRQVAMIGADGKASTHTGKKCIQGAGQHVDENYSAQANLMLTETVWDVMAEAYEKAEGDLAERIMVSLEAAEAEGGDIRGMQSVAILVVSKERAGDKSTAPLLRLHVEDHTDPLVEMRRLLDYANAYQHQTKAAGMLEENELDDKKVKAANEEFEKSLVLMPSEVNPELVFWHAVSLVEAKRVEESLPLFKQVFEIEEKWRELVPRLVPSEVLPDDKEIIAMIVRV